MNSMIKITTPKSTSVSEDSGLDPLPLETEIYILPDGRVFFADLPAELSALAASLSATSSATDAPRQADA